MLGHRSAFFQRAYAYGTTLWIAKAYSILDPFQMQVIRIGTNSVISSSCSSIRCISKGWKFSASSNHRAAICHRLDAQSYCKRLGATVKNDKDAAEERARDAEPAVSTHLELGESNPTSGVNSSEDANHQHNAAVHELEHRATHAGITEGTKLLSEKLVSTLEKGVARQSKQLRSRVGDHVVTRHGLEAVQEQVGERLGRQVATRSEELLAERAGERVAQHGLETASERATEQLGKRMTERVGMSSSKLATAAERTGVRILLRRIGRGVLIALPLLGAAFALYQLRLDMERALLERRRPKALVSTLFASAALSDGADAVCHLALAYSVFAGVHHDILHLLEALSVACAVVSTLCAVGGEVCCRSRAYPVQAQPTSQGKDSPM